MICGLVGDTITYGVGKSDIIRGVTFSKEALKGLCLILPLRISEGGPCEGHGVPGKTNFPMLYAKYCMLYAVHHCGGEGLPIIGRMKHTGNL